MRIEPPLVLAPMEDVTNQAFRRIAKRIARPSLMFTEFVSAMAIHYQAKKTWRKMRIHPDERPLGIQIFGGDPAIMAETALVAEEMGADLIDINMGCWVPKVCKTGSGAALLKDPELAERIVAAVVRSVRVPVSVKVRAGWDWSLFAAPELARRFEAAGAKMLTLHARFAKQGFEGSADWSLLAALRDAVTIPLVGNGDVRTGEDALRMMRETGCDGVMVGRAAISNPWALARIRATMARESIPPEPTIEERVALAIEHAKLMVAFEAEVNSYDDVSGLCTGARADAEERGIRALRGQLPLYIKGEPGSAAVRGRLTACSSVLEVEAVLHSFLAAVGRGSGMPAPFC